MKPLFHGLGSVVAIMAATAIQSSVQRPSSSPWNGDLGDGRYRNPVLHADYSDPDVVRVGDDFYMTASSFVNVPGLPILHSRDLVNWRLIGHALPEVTPVAHFKTPRRGGGVWAPAIRFNRGRFVIYYPDPNFGIRMIHAVDPRGPWSAPVLVDDTLGAIDPAPFWDDDGRGWLVFAFAMSRAGKANQVVLKRLNADGTATQGPPSVIIDGDRLPPARSSIGPQRWRTTEGPKLYKRDGWYYLFAPSGGVKGGWQGVFRARGITGPYEGRNVLDQGRTDVNGPHQGAWVDTPAGEDWFVHFQDKDSFGRVVHLQPMRWVKGWPVIGADPDGDGIGEPVSVHRKPRLPVQPMMPLQTDDEFDGRLSLAWQWNANPGEDWADPSQPGVLRLKSVSAPRDLYEAGNVLSQKLPGPAFTATTKMHFRPLRDGERAGLVMLGTAYGFIGAERRAGTVRLIQSVRTGANATAPEVVAAGPSISDTPVWLRLTARPVTMAGRPAPTDRQYWPSELKTLHAEVRFGYSLDGERFLPLGGTFQSQPGGWVGAQLGLFAQAPTGSPAYIARNVGAADFDWFRVTR